MSKGSLFWANASGRLGEAVYYRSGGEQRTRAYVKNVKNPKTEAQMRNRIQMGNWVAMYRRLKPILEKTFTNRPLAESGFNALVKANKSRLRYAVDSYMLQDCDYNALGAKVSSGTIICNIEPKFVEQRNVAEPNTPPRYYTQMMEFRQVPFTIRDQASPDDALQGKELYQILTANGNPMQLPSNFKLIVLYGRYEFDDETGKWADGTPLSYRIIDCNSTSESTGVFIGNVALETLTRITAIADNYVADTGTNVRTMDVSGLAVGGSVSPTDMETDIFGMIIYYENSSGKNANNAFIYGYKNGESLASQYAEGGDVFDQILENVGFNASSALSGSSAVRKPDFSDYVIDGYQAEENPDDGGGMDDESGTE